MYMYISKYYFNYYPPFLSLKVVSLDKSYTNIGMHIIGGSDYINRIFGSGEQGVYISKVSHTHHHPSPDSRVTRCLLEVPQPLLVS